MAGGRTFTRPILEKLGPNATLLTIDTNPEFTKFLKESIDDDRLVTVTGSAADVEKILSDRGFAHADFVLSGLPFSTLPPGVGDAIGEATARVIRPGGEFLVYQFSPRSKSSSRRGSTASTVGSNGKTCRRRPCSGLERRCLGRS